MKCNCDNWANGIKEIDGAISFAATHGNEYKGGIFRFCPWCGDKLTFSPEEEILMEIFGNRSE